VAGVEVGELDLTLGSLALRRARSRALACDRVLAQPGRVDGLSLQRVDPAQQPGEQPCRIAADLVAAKRELVDAVEQDREPVGGADGGEERVEPGLDRVLAQQRLRGLGVGPDPQLLVGAVDEQLGALAESGPRGPRAADDDDVLGTLPALDQCPEPQRERLRAPRPRGAEHQQRPVAVLGYQALALGWHALAVSSPRHRVNASALRRGHRKLTH
jgi:hypothetical protein